MEHAADDAQATADERNVAYQHVVGLMLRFALLVVSLIIAGASVVVAQDPMDEARAAADAGRLVEARDILQGLMEREPTPGAAANLAMVQRAMGELLAAQRLLERLVAGDFGELAAERQQQATALLREVRGEVSSVSVVVRGAPIGAQVRSGGRPVGTTDATHRVVFPSDPGTHVLQITSGNRTIDREVEVDLGTAVSVEVDFSEAPTPVPTPQEVAEDAANAEVVASRPPRARNIAIGVSLALVVAAVAVVVAIVLSGDSLPSQPDGYLGAARL